MIWLNAINYIFKMLSIVQNKTYIAYNQIQESKIYVLRKQDCSKP